MSDPVFRPLNQGDTQDDDGQVTDSLVMAEATPPTLPVTPIVTPSLPQPAVPTRLLSVRQRVDPAWPAPTMVLPEDTRRKSLHIRCRAISGGSADDAIAITSEVRGTGGLAYLHTANTSGLDLHSYTGAVWVTAVGAMAVLVDVWSVTE